MYKLKNRRKLIHFSGCSIYWDRAVFNLLFEILVRKSPIGTVVSTHFNFLGGGWCLLEALKWSSAPAPLKIEKRPIKLFRRSPPPFFLRGISFSGGCKLLLRVRRVTLHTFYRGVPPLDYFSKNFQIDC